MKVVTEILQDLEILKRLLKHNANLKIRINYYLTSGTFLIYLLGLCNFTKLSNICHHDLLKVLKHPIKIDRLINMTFEKQ